MLFAQQLAILFSMHLFVLVTLISYLIAQTQLCFIIRNESRSLHFEDSSILGIVFSDTFYRFKV